MHSSFGDPDFKGNTDLVVLDEFGKKN